MRMVQKHINIQTFYKTDGPKACKYAYILYGEWSESTQICIPSTRRLIRKHKHSTHFVTVSSCPVAIHAYMCVSVQPCYFHRNAAKRSTSPLLVLASGQGQIITSLAVGLSVLPRPRGTGRNAAPVHTSQHNTKLPHGLAG